MATLTELIPELEKGRMAYIPEWRKRGKSPEAIGYFQGFYWYVYDVVPAKGAHSAYTSGVIMDYQIDLSDLTRTDWKLDADIEQHVSEGDYFHLVRAEKP